MKGQRQESDEVKDLTMKKENILKEEQKDKMVDNSTFSQKGS